MRNHSFMHTEFLDNNTLESLSQGNEAALKKIIEKYYQPLFNYGSKFCDDRTIVSDCIQDIFVYFWEKRSSIKEIKSIRSYLFSSLRHNLIKILQQGKRHVDITKCDSFLNVDDNAEQQLILQELNKSQKQHLQKAIESLPKRQREALYLRYYEDLNYDEIAEVMNLSKQSVANYLQYALEKLRKDWKYAVVLVATLLGF